MKNTIYLIALFFIALVACTSEEEMLFDQSAQERQDAVASAQKSILTNDDGLWIAYYYGYGILMKFGDDNTVEFTSSFNEGNDDRTISYRIDNIPESELVFESHSVFHAIYDQNIGEAEYDFVIDSLNSEKVYLTSLTDEGENKTHLTFYKAKPSDLEEYVEMSSKIKDAPIYKYLTFEGAQNSYLMVLGSSNARFIVTSEDGSVRSIERDYIIGKTGITFIPSLVLEEHEISTLEYSADDNTYNAIIDGIQFSVEVSETSQGEPNGEYSKLLSNNFKSIEEYSPALQIIPNSTAEGISGFSGYQLYMQWGYLLCYANGSWAGFTDFTFVEQTENEMTVEWGMGAYGSWWQDVYATDGANTLLNFLLAENGLVIIDAGEDVYYLVNKDDPTEFILIQ